MEFPARDTETTKLTHNLCNGLESVLFIFKFVVAIVLIIIIILNIHFLFCKYVFMLVLWFYFPYFVTVVCGLVDCGIRIFSIKSQ